MDSNAWEFLRRNMQDCFSHLEEQPLYYAYALQGFGVVFFLVGGWGGYGGTLAHKVNIAAHRHAFYPK